jgi:hypothetical protein
MSGEATSHRQTIIRRLTSIANALVGASSSAGFRQPAGSGSDPGGTYPVPNYPRGQRQHDNAYPVDGSDPTRSRLSQAKAPGKLTALSSDGTSRTTAMPLLDGARYWQSLGAASTASTCTVWSGDSGAWALRSTIGHAAKLTVSTNQPGTPIFVPHAVQ